MNFVQSSLVRQFSFCCYFYYENENLCSLQFILKKVSRNIGFSNCLTNKLGKEQKQNPFFLILFFYRANLKIGACSKTYLFLEQGKRWATFPV